jgi:hypothetical protein
VNEEERVSGWPQPDEIRAPSPVLFQRVLAVAAALGILGLAWLGFVLISPIDLPFQHVEATMTPTVSMDGATAQVEGTTTLPDGAVINYYYWHADDAVNSRNDGAHGGLATVHDGRFAFASDLSDWPPGRVTLYTEFSVGWDTEQPADVVSRFGSEGEHMAGPQVYVDSPGDPKMLLVPVEFELATAPAGS